MYVFLKHWNPVEIKKWFKSIKIEDNYFRYFFCFLRERIENERTRRQQHKKNMHVWPARMRRRWISARPLERNPQRKRNKLSGPGVGTWMRAGKELNWKKKMFPERTEKEKKKKKKECFFFFFSSKDNKCRKTTKDLGVMVHYHVCSFSPVIWTRAERTHLWVDIGRRYAQQTALVRGNMSKLYYVIPTILLQGKGIDWKTAFASSHLFPLPPQC